MLANLSSWNKKKLRQTHNEKGMIYRAYSVAGRVGMHMQRERELGDMLLCLAILLALNRLRLNCSSLPCTIDNRRNSSSTAHLIACSSTED